MKNNKLLKRLLMSSALGAISLGGAVDILAVEIPFDANLATLAGFPNPAGPNVDYKFITNNNINLTINHAIVNGQINKLSTDANVATANIIVEHNVAANQDYKIQELASGRNTGTVFKFTQVNADDSLTIAKVNAANSTVLVHGADTNIILANTDAVTHLAKIFTTDGDAGAQLTIAGKSKAGSGANEGYIAASGTIKIKNDSEGRYEATTGDSTILFDASDNNIEAKGDAVLKQAGAKLKFSMDKVGQTRNINFTGKVKREGGAGQILVATANGNLNVTLEDDIGSEVVDTNIDLIQVTSANANNKSTLTLTGNSFATNYKYGANSTLVLDSKKGDVKHKGTFGTAIANTTTGTIKTTGANNVTLDGPVAQGKLVVGTASDKKTIVTQVIGSVALAEVEFDDAVKGGYLQATQFANNSTVDFKGTGSTLEVKQGTVTFRANTNVSGSTVKLSSVDKDLILVDPFGKADQLLNVDASVIGSTANGVQVANDSFFDVIDTGAGKLNHNGATTISAKKVKGAEITVSADGLTINMLEKDAIESAKINFTEDVELKINGYNGDFGTLKSEVTNTANAAAGTLALTGSGTISSEKIGTGNSLSILNIAQNNAEIVTFNIANPNHKHNIATINVGVGTARFASAYNNDGNLNVVANGTVDLTSEGPDGVVGNVVTLSGTGIFQAAAGAQLRVTDGSQLKLVNAPDNAFNVVLDSQAYGDDNGKVLIISKIDGTNLADLKAGTAKISPDQNLFATDKLEYVDQAGAVVAAAGNFAKAYAVRSIDSKKLENFVKGQNFTGDLKEFSDSLVKVGDKATGALRKFDILAGSDKDRAAANLASALPRNLIETQKNTLRTQSLVGVTRSVANGAADDLKSSAGLWVKGSFGKGSQQVSDIASSSYDSTLWGGTAGAEFNLGESVTIGAAGSYTKTTLEYKGLRQGDKDVFKSILGSVYGFATFSNNIVLNASFVAGNTDVEGTTTSINGKSSKGDDKISAISYGGTVLGGYKFSGSSFSITPLAGLSFANFTDPARKTGYGHASVKKADVTRVDLIGGVSIAGTINAADMVVVPELHGFVHYNLKGEKAQKTLDFNGGQAISYMGSDTTKTNLLLGGAITAKSGMIEYGVSVDGQFADKYWGVLGSLKLKVNL